MWISVGRNFNWDKSLMSVPPSNFWHVFRIEQSFFSLFFFYSFFFFFLALALGLRGPFTVKPNWVRGDCPFLQSCGRSHKSRHPSFVTPLSPSSWHDPTLGLCSGKAYPEPADWPPDRLGNQWARCALPLGPRAAPSAWEGVRGTSF